MGAGASFDADPSMEMGNGMRGSDTTHFCHQCLRPTRVDTSLDGISCSTCLSSFVEEIQPNSTRGTYDGAMMLAGGSHSHDNTITIPAPGGRYYSNLSEDQNRRLANAAIMLRLLEAQLRDELDNLQMLQAQREKKLNPLTKIMKRKLREIPLSLDQICSQPSCPICSEDFVVDETSLCLPCSHLFHKECVMQWLESKRTCPICRYEMTNSVSTIEELERLSFKELVSLLEEIYIENDIVSDSPDRLELNTASSSHRENATLVHREIEKYHRPTDETNDDSEGNAVRDTTSVYDNTEFTSMIRRHLLALGPSGDDITDSTQDDSMPTRTHLQPRMLPRLIASGRTESLNTYDSSGFTGSRSYAIGNTYVLRSDGRAHVVSTPETRMSYEENRNSNEID